MNLGIVNLRHASHEEHQKYKTSIPGAKLFTVKGSIQAWQ